MKVERSPEVFAAWDGKGTLTLCTPESFDPDDSLAQFLFHEICHSLVEGPGSHSRPDWGLVNEDERDLHREHAAHRLQAALAQRFGLRTFLAVTTDFRPYYEALPPNPLGDSDDPALLPAREGWERARHGKGANVLEEALRATASLASLVRPFAPPHSLWHTVVPLHPSGVAPRGDRGTCGTCAWSFISDGRRRSPLSCRQGAKEKGRPSVEVRGDDGGCVLWEPVLEPSSCPQCAACCREGFDVVPLGRREPLRLLHPEWVVRDRHGLHLPRPKGRCVALTPVDENGHSLCRAYSDRPRSCRQFPVGGDACLEARRRTGISPTA